MEQYRYRLTSLGHNSSVYGPCEVCEKPVSEVFLQVEERFYSFTENDGQKYEGWTQAKCFSYFGHEDCLKSKQRGGEVEAKKEELRPDVIAYLSKAAIEIAGVQGFQPSSPEAMKEWLVENRVAIGTRAIDLQWDLLNKLGRPGIQEKVSRLIGAKVWEDLACSSIHRQVNKLTEEVLA